MDAVGILGAVSIGALLGLAVRFALKLILTLLGILALLLFALEHYGIITVNWDALINVITNIISVIASLLASSMQGQVDLNQAGNVVAGLIAFIFGIWLGGKLG